VRVLLRIIAVFAGASAAVTLWFVVDLIEASRLDVLVASPLLGGLTVFGWLLAVVAGPVTAVQLWRFQEIGRRAGIGLFGYGAAYYLAGLFVLRGPDASVWRIGVSVITFALPLGVLLSRRAQEICAPARSIAGAT
jgi:hypothetical protein